jgi:hypothetical protein
MTYTDILLLRVIGKVMYSKSNISSFEKKIKKNNGSLYGTLSINYN